MFRGLRGLRLRGLGFGIWDFSGKSRRLRSCMTHSELVQDNCRTSGYAEYFRLYHLRTNAAYLKLDLQLCAW